MSTQSVKMVSEWFIKPHRSSNEQEVSTPKVCHLTPWDVAMLSVHYIQKGLLFKKPQNHENGFTQNLLGNLKQSLSLALSHFYPLAGRLVTHKTQDPHSYSVSVDCINSPGARFIYSTLDLTASDILSPVDVPRVVQSFFDHDRAVNHDGHTMPLLSIQVTELIDSIFIACSMNHSLGDGTSYWTFFNVFSEIFQSRVNGVIVPPISHEPVLNRWFPEGCGQPPINLPFKHHDAFVRRYEAPNLRERIFHFSADSIAKLKSKANRESNTTKISSFQSLSALVWRCITRARRLPHDQMTNCRLATNNRTRMEPPMPEEYFGNSIHVVGGVAKAVELLEHDLGWAAWKLHLAVVNHNNRAILDWGKEWLQSPLVYNLEEYFDPYCVMMGNSPRFNVYGNEFGMGKAVAVRSGYANKFDGKVTSYPGCEGGGSIDLEICLLPDNMSALESDQEFMTAVSVSNNLLY